MVDRLAALLRHFTLHASTFQTGTLCGVHQVETAEPFGQLHLIREGQVEVWHGNQPALLIQEASLLLYPRPLPHRFVTDMHSGADLVCANVAFEGGFANPIATALPPFICLPLSDVPSCEPVLSLLFREAATANCGRQTVLDRLFEVLLVMVLRELMERGMLKSGLLAGMSHPKLRRALVAMHEAPQREWSLEELAAQAGMSRTAFANAFRNSVGYTPVVYLQRWRIGLAKKLLSQGRALKYVAADVGYASEAVLSRAFKMHTGLSPRAWLKDASGDATQENSSQDTKRI